MLGLMMDMPLLITDNLRYAAVIHGDTQIIFRNVNGGIHRYSYAAAKQRRRQLTASGKIRKAELREIQTGRAHFLPPHPLPPDSA